MIHLLTIITHISFGVIASAFAVYPYLTYEALHSLFSPHVITYDLEYSKVTLYIVFQINNISWLISIFKSHVTNRKSVGIHKINMSRNNLNEFQQIFDKF